MRLTWTHSALLLLVALHFGSPEELEANTSRSFLHSLDEKRESKRTDTSIVISAPHPSATVEGEEESDEGEGESDDGEGESDNEEDAEKGEDTDEGDASGKQESKSLTADKNSAQNDKPSPGMETDWENDDDDTSGELTDDADESALTNHNAQQFSLNDDDTQEDNAFPDEDDESEDVDEDEQPPVGMSPGMYSHVRSTDQVQDFVNFQADEDEDEHEAGSTGEFAEYSGGSTTGFTAKDLSPLAFSGNEKKLSFSKNKAADVSKKNKTVSKADLRSQKSTEKMGNVSSTEGRKNSTTKPHSSASKHSELSKPNATRNATNNKQKFHTNSKNSTHEQAKGHPGVKHVPKKIRGKPAITVLSHSSKKHIKGRFKVPRGKFLGKGVSVIGYTSRNTTFPHRLVKQRCPRAHILEGHSLKGGTRAGHVAILGETADMQTCMKRCCHAHACEVALRVDGSCYGVTCYSSESCQSIPVPNPRYVQAQMAFMNNANKRDGVSSEINCKYGNLTLRNNERWSGELCGGVVVCKDGVATVKKCPGIPRKPKKCYSPKLTVKHRKGKCCKMSWSCKGKDCVFGGRVVKHGYSLSDPLCTGVVRCFNGKLEMQFCPKIPDKPNNCARPRLKVVTQPGQCCKKYWVCSDKSCKYDSLKLAHGEKATDASCAVVMKCENGFLSSESCPGPPLVPTACINPSLDIRRVPGKCCEMSWKCAMS